MPAKRKKTGQKSGKPSAKQLAARAAFAAAAKARAGKSKSSSAKSKKSRPVLANKQRTEKARGARKLNKVAEGFRPRTVKTTGAEAQSDVQKVAVRTPNLVLWPISEGKLGFTYVVDGQEISKLWM